MKNEITIYCDMDGVLVDMDRFITEHLSARARVDDATLWAELQAIPNVYSRMLPTPYAKKLWAAITATGLTSRILTAIPRVTSMPSAEGDKKGWVVAHEQKVFGGKLPKSVEIGPYSKDKWKHCRYGDILIDDREDNCASWDTAGGFSILHQGEVDATIKRLKFLVDQLAA